MKTITIDQKSIDAVSAGQLGLDALCDSLSLPTSDSTAKCVLVGDHGYILSRVQQPGDGLLTISLTLDGPLTSLTPEVRQEALGRLLRCATNVFSGRARSIPFSWRPFHHGSRLSFQADRRMRSAEGGRTNAGRLVLDLVKGDAPRVFAFALDQSGTQDITSYDPPSELAAAAYKGVSAALNVQEAESVPEQLGNEVALATPDQRGPHLRVPLGDWYNSRLTAAQRKFVDYPLESSARIVGPAGSGKTVALVVKCLHDLSNCLKEGNDTRFLFLTHASSTASAIENLILDMAPDQGMAYLGQDRPPLVVTTLYALANDFMRYDLDGLTPVSLDGHEGREFQAECLNIVIEEFRRGDWVTYRSRCSPPFVAYMDAANDSNERRFFLWELLNEFACVLDAEGVRSGTERRDNYLSEVRRKWMMHLVSRQEREVVLRLYDRFGRYLRDLKAIGGDQMVADFSNHLDSYRWEAAREREGFDAVFVDELHLFNRQERMVFRHLLRDPRKVPVVFMAYDAKQSPRDTFLGLPSHDAQQYNLWRDARLGRVEKIELVDVFRYTPQIAKALTFIDQVFPGQDLDSDWPPYKGIAKTKDGPIPTVCELASETATYGVTFKRAHQLQKRLDKGQRVAVLCVSSTLFMRYLEYDELRDYFYPITSRDEALGMPHSVRRFIFSMPEYVAGLQYDTVMLLDVNRDEVPEGPYSISALRKFVSQVYLGASRAEHRLELYACAAHGGIAPLVTQAVLHGAIRKCDVSGLDKK